jgi:hypothetical protein
LASRLPEIVAMGPQNHPLALVVVAGCGPTPERADRMRKTLIQNATTQVPYVKEFHEMWPMGYVDVFSRQFEKGTTEIQATEIVHDRYELTLTVGVEVDPTKLTINHTVRRRLRFLKLRQYPRKPRVAKSKCLMESNFKSLRTNGEASFRREGCFLRPEYL